MLRTPLPRVRMSSTIVPSTHLGIKIVLDHMSRFARLFIEDLTPFICSVWRSIHLGDQLSTWVGKPLGVGLTMQRDGILLRVRIQDFVKPVLHYISRLRQSACSHHDRHCPRYRSHHFDSTVLILEPSEANTLGFQSLYALAICTVSLSMILGGPSG